MMNSNVCTANQKNYNQAMEYVNLTLERDTATKADNLLFLKFMIDSIGRDIETDINKIVSKNDFRYALLFKLSKMYFELASGYLESDWFQPLFLFLIAKIQSCTDGYGFFIDNKTERPVRHRDAPIKQGG